MKVAAEFVACAVPSAAGFARLGTDVAASAITPVPFNSARRIAVLRPEEKYLDIGEPNDDMEKLLPPENILSKFKMSGQEKYGANGQLQLVINASSPNVVLPLMTENCVRLLNY